MVAVECFFVDDEIVFVLFIRGFVSRFVPGGYFKSLPL
jgi:hypothetical protein